MNESEITNGRATWEVRFTPGALGTDGKCQNPTSKTVDIVAGPRNCFSSDISKLPIT